MFRPLWSEAAPNPSRAGSQRGLKLQAGEVLEGGLGRVARLGVPVGQGEGGGGRVGGEGGGAGEDRPGLGHAAVPQQGLAPEPLRLGVAGPGRRPRPPGLHPARLGAEAAPPLGQAVQGAAQPRSGRAAGRAERVNGGGQRGGRRGRVRHPRLRQCALQGGGGRQGGQPQVQVGQRATPVPGGGGVGGQGDPDVLVRLARGDGLAERVGGGAFSPAAMRPAPTRASRGPSPGSRAASASSWGREASRRSVSRHCPGRVSPAARARSRATAKSAAPLVWEKGRRGAGGIRAAGVRGEPWPSWSGSCQCTSSTGSRRCSARRSCT